MVASRKTMEIFNVLAVTFFGKLHSINLDFIGKYIDWLVKITGSVGIGIILFSLTLKLITMPFDVYQRISMRKQNNKMKQNQAQMEKLQKQYANDKEKYNQKVMEMYKENGISIFSSCLPMILSMVIFFIAIGAFNSYAAHSNVKNYNELVKAYNGSLQSYTVQLEDIQADDGTITCVKKTEEGKTTYTYTVKSNEADDYIYYTIPYTLSEQEEVKYTIGGAESPLDLEGLKAYYETAKENEKISFYVDEAKVKTNAPEMQAEVDALFTVMKAEDESATMTDAYDAYFEKQAQHAVVEAYDTKVKNSTKFLWIKNIWVTDASYKHPVMGYSDFSNEIVERGTCSCSTGSKDGYGAAYNKEGYALVTGELSSPKSAANGYFILIALSIGTILLQQFVSMRAQKEQQKYSSVDGQGASQQKMMLVMMTGIFAIFSFMYSSAFSTYLVVSNVFSMLSMFVINKIVDTKEKNKAAEKATSSMQQNRTAKKIEQAKEAGRKAAQEKRGTTQNKNKKK